MTSLLCYCWMVVVGLAAIVLTDADLLHETLALRGKPNSNSPCMTWEMQSEAARSHKETIH